MSTLSSVNLADSPSIHDSEKWQEKNRQKCGHLQTKNILTIEKRQNKVEIVPILGQRPTMGDQQNLERQSLCCPKKTNQDDTSAAS